MTNHTIGNRRTTWESAQWSKEEPLHGRAVPHRFWKCEHEARENLRLPRPRRFLPCHFLVSLGECEGKAFSTNRLRKKR